jgi:glycosyltransferase involved in cell wall biosynthesis
LVELSNELAKYFDVTVLLLRDTVYKNRFSPNVQIRELRSNPTRYNPFLAKELYSVLRQEKPDIVHTHAVKATELVAGINRLLKFIHIGTKHNTRKGKIFNKIRFVTAVSSAVANSIKPHSGTSMSVIHNGIIPVTLESPPKKLQSFTMIAIGRLDKIKGFDLLIRQAGLIPFDFQLLIIGQGPEKNSLQKLIEQTGMEKKIILTGYKENVPAMMKNSDMVIVCSHSEGFSKVIVESLFYAPVLISTPVGIATDLLPEPLLVQQNELAGKITEVYNNKEYYINIFKKLREDKSSEFLMSTVAKAYLQLYNHVVL